MVALHSVFFMELRERQSASVLASVEVVIRCRCTHTPHMTINVGLAAIELLAARNMTRDAALAHAVSSVMVFEVAFPIEFHVAEVAGKDATGM